MNLNIGKKKEDKEVEATVVKTQESAERKLAKGIPSVKDIIAPSAIEVDYNYM